MAGNHIETQYSHLDSYYAHLVNYANASKVSIISFKEDYERCIKYYLRDGGAVRLNWVAPVQSYCKGQGGLNQIRTLEKEKQACETLQQQYPTLVRIKQTTKSDKVDILFPRNLTVQQSRFEN